MRDPNIGILEVMVEQLGELSNDLVFVGGAMVGLYIKDKAVPTVRATIDIDCVVEVVNKVEYYNIAEKLRQKGFQEDANSEVICRFRKGELILDVMPTDTEILNFSNKWYSEGVKNKIQQILNNGHKISIFSLPFFIASKIEAFKGRGKGDYFASHDIEDLVTVFDGEPDVANQILASPLSVKSYLSEELKQMLELEDFVSSVEGHISDRINIADRASIVLRRIRLSVQPSP